MLSYLRMMYGGGERLQCWRKCFKNPAITHFSWHKIENCCPYLEDLQKFVEMIKSLEINNIGNQSSFICFYQLVFRAKLYLTVDWLSQEKWEA